MRHYEALLIIDEDVINSNTVIINICIFLLLKYDFGKRVHLMFREVDGAIMSMLEPTSRSPPPTDKMDGPPFENVFTCLKSPNPLSNNYP